MPLQVTNTIKCTACSIVKESDVFKKDSRKKSGRASICKECASVQSNIYYHTAGANYDSAKRRKKVVEAYGITLDDYDTMYQEQEGCCKICGIEEKYVSKNRFHIDHCHETGGVRGLLCSQCNKGLGMFKDNADFLLEAAKYIKGEK